MKEQANYDTCCLEENCIKNGRAFFNHSIDSEHVKGGHYIMPLLAREILIYFTKVDEQNERSRLYEEALTKNVESIVQAICLKLQKYAKKCMVQMRQKFFVCEAASNPEDIINQLKAGNYDILRKFSQFKWQRQSKFFNDYLLTQRQRRQSFFFHYLGTIQLEMERYVQQLCENATKSIQQKGLFQKMETKNSQQKREFESVLYNNEEYVPEIDEIGLIDRIAEFQISEKKSADEQFIFKDKAEMIEEQKIKMEDEEQYSELNFSKINPSNSSERQENIESKLAHKPSKTKKIEKEDISMKKKKQKKEVLLSKQANNDDKYKKQPSKNETQQKMFTVYDANNPEEVLEKIIKDKKDLQVLHILDYKFATKNILHKILLNCTNLHTLTLSCNHQFSVDLLDELSSDRLSKLKRVQLKWNMERFFMKYQFFKHFSIKRRKSIQRFDKIDNFFDFWQKLKNNQSLWLQSSHMITEFKHRGISLSKIKYLSYAPAKQQHYGDMYLLPKLEGLNNLLTLSLVQIRFEDDTPLRQLISQNKNLKSIILFGCIGLNVDKALKSMAQLPCLTRLSISQFQNQSLKVKPRVLFKLVNLKELYLDQINFDDSVDQYRSSKCLEDIRELKKLTHLSLYACNPVFSDIFEYISMSSQRKMKYLCLGSTCVDRKCLPKILQMDELEYLDLDSVEITGSDLLTAFGQRYVGALSSSPLKYLSLEEPIEKTKNKNKPRFSVSQLKQLSRYLSNLVYLDIAGCHNIEEFSFKCFISLNKLAMDKFLAQKLAKYVVSTIKIFKIDQS